MVVKSVTHLLLACCLLVGAAFGQTGSRYTQTLDTPTWTDNSALCNGTYKCWVTITTSPVITQVSSGNDGTTYGLDSHGAVWFLQHAGRTWQTTALSPMSQLSVKSATSVYALQSNSYCGAPEMRAYLYTGGTDFVAQNFCAVNISVGADGTLYRIRGSGNVSHFVSGSWVSDTTAGGNGTPIKLAVGAANNVWLITSTGVIKALNGSGSFVVMTSTATDITASANSDNTPTTASGDVWIIGPTVNGTNVYKYDYTLNNWTAKTGVYTSITGGGLFSTYALNSTGGVSHFNPMTFSVNYHVDGYFACGGGCPSNAVHTATAKFTWSRGGKSGQGTSSGTPATVLHASFLASTNDCDFIDWAGTDPFCQGGGDGTVNCTVMGVIPTGFSLVNLGNWSIVYEIATTVLMGNGAMKCTTSAFGTLCTQPVTAWCSNTTAPDLNPPVIITSPPQWTEEFDDTAACARILLDGAPTINSFWHCSPGLVIRVPSVQPGICTYNP